MNEPRFARVLDRELTEELGEEKAVALLEGDTLPAQIFRPALFFVDCTAHRIEEAYLEYLSSGEKRAGWADLVTSPWLTFLRV